MTRLSRGRESGECRGGLKAGSKGKQADDYHGGLRKSLRVGCSHPGPVDEVQRVCAPLGSAGTIFLYMLVHFAQKSIFLQILKLV